MLLPILIVLFVWYVWYIVRLLRATPYEQPSVDEWAEYYRDKEL